VASYTELGELFNNTVLRSRIEQATYIAAIMVQEESPGTAQRRNWSASVLSNVKAWAERMHMALLVANKDLTKAQIEAASDTAIQTRVDAKVDDFANGVL